MSLKYEPAFITFSTAGMLVYTYSRSTYLV